MTTTAPVETTQPNTSGRRPVIVRNGVDTPSFFATIDAVREQRDLAAFQFRATNRWISGTHSRTRMEPFTGAGGEHAHKASYTCDADHPAVFAAEDEGPTPVEALLHALASCLTAGIANIAAARGVDLTEVESTVEGDIDMQGLLGLSDEVRNGYERIRIGFKVRGNAPPEKLREIVEQSRARSAVYDVLTNGTSVTVSMDA